MGTPPTGALNARGGYEKVAISDQYLSIARKRLKIDGYMYIQTDRRSAYINNVRSNTDAR